MKKLLSLCVALTATIGMWAGNVITYTAPAKLTETTSTYSSGLHTDAFGTGVSISSHTFSDGTGTITFNNDVTQIGYAAFYGCSNMTSVTIPSSVTTIAGFAFNGCRGLTSVIIPNGVTRINSSAFQGCTGLISVSIPNSVTTIESNAFSGVRNISYSGSADGSPWGAKTRNGCVDGYLVFTNNSKTNLSGCSTAATGNIVIPNSVTNINESALDGCSGLTSVTMSNNLSTIGNSAFHNCSNLTSVHIDDIENWCSISFGSDDSNPLYYAHHLFLDDSEVSDLVIPNGVTSIGNRAFYGCSSIASLTIPNSVTSIGFYAFRDCSSLTSIEIPNSVISMGSGAFTGCTNLTSIVWNPSQCSCPTSTSISLGTPQVTSFTFGNGVTIIPNGLCSGFALTTISIPNNVISIEEHAFSYCDDLTSVTIGNGVTSIGNYAFYYCDGLTSITCKAINPPTISNNYTFYQVNSVPVYVPCESVDDYQAASYWSNFTNIQGYDCSYSRSMTIGKYGTICIPKAVNSEDVEGGVFFNIVYAVTNTSDEVTGILMEEVTGDLVAGKSYIFRATADELVLTYTGSSVENPVAATGLVGNLDEDPIDVPQGMFVLSNNQIRKLNGGSATIGQNRAYIDLTSVTKLNYVPTAAPGRIMLYVEDNNPVVTDVRNSNAEKKPVKILKDGMIVIIRDGKTYDMLGNTL